MHAADRRREKGDSAVSEQLEVLREAGRNELKALLSEIKDAGCAHDHCTTGSGRWRVAKADE